MGAVIKFATGRTAAPGNGRQNRVTAEVIIFPGVRVERGEFDRTGWVAQARPAQQAPAQAVAEIS